MCCIKTLLVGIEGQIYQQFPEWSLPINMVSNGAGGLQRRLPIHQRGLTRFVICLIIWFLCCKCDFDWAFSVVDEFMDPSEASEDTSKHGGVAERSSESQYLIGK